MRINKFVALCTDLSRRTADGAVASGRISINGLTASAGSQVKPTDTVCLDGVKLTPRMQHTTIVLNKPVGYVCSRKGQGSKTIFELLPEAYQHLQPVGRLDKDSSGLLLLTDDGYLANELTHPSRGKVKVYEVTLDKPLQPLHQQMISDIGITLEDGLSQFLVTRRETRDKKYETRKEDVPRSSNQEIRQQPGSSPALTPYSLPLNSCMYEVRMTEGRNRQIRRTFAALGYTVTRLHRTQLGSYHLDSLASGTTALVSLPNSLLRNSNTK